TCDDRSSHDSRTSGLGFGASRLVAESRVQPEHVSPKPHHAPMVVDAHRCQKQPSLREPAGAIAEQRRLENPRFVFAANTVRPTLEGITTRGESMSIDRQLA